MTVGEYLLQRDHLRFVVASPTAPEGSVPDPERTMTAIVTSAHGTEAAAKEALRWERDRIRRRTGDRTGDVDLLVVDLDSGERGSRLRREGSPRSPREQSRRRVVRQAARKVAKGDLGEAPDFGDGPRHGGESKLVEDDVPTAADPRLRTSPWL